MASERDTSLAAAQRSMWSTVFLGSRMPTKRSPAMVGGRPGPFCLTILLLATNTFNIMASRGEAVTFPLGPNPRHSTGGENGPG